MQATDRSRRPQVGWGGGEPRDKRATTLPNDASSYTRPHAHAPPTRSSEEKREGARRGRPEGRPRPESQFARGSEWIPVMILPQVHLRKPCYDFSFL